MDKTLEAFSAMQRPDDGFGSWGTVNSESCAQAIVALTAPGIDLATDSDFVKKGFTGFGRPDRGASHRSLRAEV